MTASSPSAARAAVDELEGLLAGATPGPWACNDQPTTWVGGREGQVWSVPLRESGECADEVADTMEHADAAAIVGLRNLAPQLLAAIKAVDELADDFDRWPERCGGVQNPNPLIAAAYRTAAMEVRAALALAAVDVTETAE